MKLWVTTLCVVSSLVVAQDTPSLQPLTGAQGNNTNEDEALRFLQRYDSVASQLCSALMEASWRYNTNVTAHNRRVMVRGTTGTSGYCCFSDLFGGCSTARAAAVEVKEYVTRAVYVSLVCARAAGVCVCVRVLLVCVCARAAGVCVCARAAGVCVCVYVLLVCVCARAAGVCARARAADVCVRARAAGVCVCVCACTCTCCWCVCVCVHVLLVCVCVHVLLVCVCARAAGVCVCVCARAAGHTSLKWSRFKKFEVAWGWSGRSKEN
ncbi:Peptidase M2 peptidyl-dipeptidase A [Trinorchestia longiramus]|nr:Peptidase M2 peptidyl-dipeptidase A [Trinorchestia longiramus]